MNHTDVVPKHLDTTEKWTRLKSENIGRNWLSVTYDRYLNLCCQKEPTHSPPVSCYVNYVLHTQSRSSLLKNFCIHLIEESETNPQLKKVLK